MKRQPIDGDSTGGQDVPVVDATVSQTGSGDVASVERRSARGDEASRYVVQSEVARGGLGRVLKAHDERLDRPVALKESLASGGVLDERFRREAAITARLQHPSIVPVYDAGTWTSGAPYYVMKLLGGGSTLKQLVAAAKDLDGRLALLPHVIAVADAIAYAHSLDIIHRDLKPSNVLVGPFGETLVIDWGLAKDLARPSAEDDFAGDPYRSAAPELTSAGSVIGTPQYMAPEQARGEAVDKRADVYSLGALLYYMLSGEPPYAGDSSGDVLARVRAHEPMALGERSQAIPKDLAAIVGKAMARLPGDRYASAGELVEDLKRFQTGQLVGAQEYSAATLVRRWIGRHRAPLAVALVFFVASSAMALVGVRRIARARDTANAKRNELILLQAQSVMKEDPTKAMAWLKSYPLDGSDWTTVQALAARAVSLGVARQLLPTGIVMRSMVLPDGKRLVTASADLSVKLWDIESGAMLASGNVEDTPSSLRVAPDGSSIAIGSAKGAIQLWSPDKHEMRMLARQDAVVSNLQFSPDSQYLAAGGPAGPTIWNTGNGSGRRVVGHAGAVFWDLFGKDSAVFYSAGADGQVLRTTVDAMRSTVLGRHHGEVTSLALSDDGALLATSGEDGTVRIWPTTDGSPRFLQTSPHSILWAAFLPHGHQLAVESNRVVSVWDADRGVEMRRLHPLPEETLRSEPSPDGTLLAMSGPDSGPEIWNWSTNRSFALRGAGPILSLAFAPDETLITAGMDKETREWAASSRPLTPRRVFEVEAALSHLVVSPDERILASTGGNSVFVCTIETAACRTFAGHTSSVYGLTFSPDGKQILSAGFDRSARLWNVADGTSRALQVAAARVNKAIFSPDGRQIVAATSDGSIYLWPVDGGEPTVWTGHVGDVRSVAFSPSGKQLASVGDDHAVRLWDMAKGTSRILGTHDNKAYYAVFSPDGASLVTGSDDATVRLWDLARGTWREIARYRELVSGVVFSGDGHSILSIDWDGNASVWNVRTERARTLPGDQSRLRSLAISFDGKLAATGADDGKIRVWNIETGALQVLTTPASTARALAFLADDSLVSASHDKTIRIWDPVGRTAAPAEPAALSRWMSSITKTTLH